MRKIRLNPRQISFLCFLFLCLSISCIYGFISLQNAAKSLKKTKQAVSHAIQRTQNNLSFIFYEIAHDPLIAGQIDEGLKNSLTQNLFSYLKAEQLDQLHLFDQNCQSIVSVSIKKMPVLPCVSNKKSELSWTKTTEGVPIAFLTAPFFLSEKPFFLNMQVIVDKHWIYAYKLADYLDRFDLDLNLFSDNTQDVVFLAQSLAVTSSSFKTYLVNLISKEISYFLFLAIFSIFCGILLFLLYISEKNKDQQIELEQKNVFEQEIKKALVEKNNVLNYQNKASSLGEYKEIYTTILNFVHAKLNLEKNIFEKNKEIALINERLMQSKNSVRSVNLEVKRDGAFTKLFKVFAPFYYEPLFELQKNLKELSSVKVKHMSENIDMVADTLKNFQEGISRQTARKYAVLLADARGHGAKSILENQIDFLAETALVLSENVRHVASHLNAVEAAVDPVVDMLVRWESMLMPQSDSQKTSFREALEKASQQMSLFTGHKFSFDFPKNTDTSLDLITIPMHALVSVIHHALLMISLLNDKKQIFLSVRFLEKNGNKQYILSTLVDSEKYYAKQNILVEHTDIMNSLLSSFGLKGVSYPLVDNIFSIVWSDVDTAYIENVNFVPRSVEQQKLYL